MKIKLTTIEPQASLEELSINWLALQNKVNNRSFFLSWEWMSQWLEQTQQRVYLLELSKQGELLGLGFLVNKTTDQWPFKKQQLWLNKTGNDVADQMWIEYNDFLLNPDFAEESREAILEFLLKQNTLPWRELHIDMCFDYSAYQQSVQRIPALTIREKLSTPGYKNDLTAQVLLKGFSKNTQKQINRSIKLLEQQGDLQLQIAAMEDKLLWLESIADLHKQQWRPTEWGSGFDNPVFTQFHQSLIKQQSTVLIKLNLNNKALAYGYYFCFNNQVLFYLSAMEKSDDNRIKVGLVLHYKAMQYFAEIGFQEYDFLAGEARYKSSLSDQQYNMTSFCIVKKGLRSSLENALRWLKNRLLAR